MKYFNKDFFKFTFGFLIIIALSLLIIGAVSAYAAGVEKIVFITDSQTILPNTISLPLTIQAQDSNSSSIQTTETIDLEFLSSSPTGEFLNSAGAPATKTMSKNTANRTFYYRDSTSGTFSITVNAVGRDSLNKWSATQTITVSSSASANSNNEENNQENTDNEIDIEENSSLSSTSGPNIPNYSTPSTNLEVSFGSDRITTPGSPINFQAFIKKNTSSNGSVSFSWSFGDGSVGNGALVSHIYKHPGDYAVILNSKSGNIFSTSRAKVKVVEPSLSLIKHENYIEIQNNSTVEANLFNWKIISEGKAFIFQIDTIVLPKSKISIDNSMLSMKGEVNNGETILKNSLGVEVAFIKDPMTKEALIEAESNLQKISKEALGILDLAISKNLVREQSPKQTVLADNKINQNLKAEVLGVSIEASTTEDTSNVIYEASKKKNFVSSVLAAIIGIFD